MESENIAEIRAALVATGEEVTDDAGNVLGYVAQPATFKIEQSYLARGGFLVVTRDEESGQYIGTEYDSLPHPRSGRLYPAGHSERAWTAATLNEALTRVLAYFEHR